MKLPQLIAQQKKTLVAMVGVLCVLWFAQSYISEWVGKPSTGKELKQPEAGSFHNTTSPQPNSQPVAVDPFKEFLAQKDYPSKPPLAETPVPTGGKPADPFKAYLENQRQQLEAAKVSPFGK